MSTLQVNRGMCADKNKLIALMTKNIVGASIASKQNNNCKSRCLAEYKGTQCQFEETLKITKEWLTAKENETRKYHVAYIHFSVPLEKGERPSQCSVA